MWLTILNNRISAIVLLTKVNKRYVILFHEINLYKYGMQKSIKMTCFDVRTHFMEGLNHMDVCMRGNY